MQPVLSLVVHEFRARWRGWAVLVLLVAVAGGAVLAAAAGARRTSSAYPRYLHASHASDLLVSVAGTGLTGFYGALARQPGVALLARGIGLNVQPADRAGRLDWAATTEAPAGRVLGHGLDAPRVLAGRLPRLDRAGEIAVDQIAAAALHLRVGSTLAMEALGNAGLPGSGTGPGPAVPPRRLRERVVGIVVTRSSADPVTDIDKVAFIQASPALAHQLGPRYRAFDGAFVKLAPGATAGQVSHEAQALALRFPATQGQVYVADENAQVATIERGIRPEAIALAIFTLALACTALLIVGQAATRLLLGAAADNPVLAALGMTRGQLAAAELIEITVAGTAGAILAAGVAVAASPLMPIGAARLAEPDPGASADWLVLAAGGVIIVLLLVARTLWPAWRLASVRGTAAREAAAGAGRRSRLAGWLAGAGAPVTMTAGARLAMEPGRGRTAVPVRAALAGTTLSVLAVTAAFTFGANLLHLVHSPRLYGQTWDAAIDLQFSPILPSQAQKLFGTNPGVTGWTYGDHGIIGIKGHLVPAIGLAPGRGPLISPTLLAGHPPRNGREVVLGSSTLHDLGLHVGQEVPVTVNGRQTQDRVVGQAVFPNFGQGSFTPTDLGEGAETTAAVLGPQAVPRGERPGFQVVLLRFATGPGRGAAVSRFRHAMAGFCADVQQSTCVELGQRPNGVTNYARIDGTPEVLAALLAVLGVAVLGQLVVISSRRRRHDFAVLKALGLLRRQVSEIAAWQVSTLAGLALLIGLPLGVAAGRWSWQLFGNGLGIPADATVPVPLVLLMVPAVILIANAVALWPGRSAARVTPAQVLRTE
ncbi:MAG TPA: FtsX-like permease family protein [Streptosporangiaceae bacterium]